MQPDQKSKLTVMDSSEYFSTVERQDLQYHNSTNIRLNVRNVNLTEY